MTKGSWDIVFIYRQLPVAITYWKRHGLLAMVSHAATILQARRQQQRTRGGKGWTGHGTAATSGEVDSRPLQKQPRAVFGRGRVALIGAIDLPQCRKYRVLQKLEQLRKRAELDVVVSSSQDVQRALDSMQLATSVIFYRLPYGRFFEEYVEEAKRLRLPILYDIDDPIFSSVIYAANSNLALLDAVERASLLAECPTYLRAMRHVDGCIVSTPGMKEAVSSQVDCPVYLWRNAMDEETLSIVRDLLMDDRSDGNALSGVDETLTIGYMSGSRAHDADFRKIESALARILKQFPNVKLLIKGHAKGGPELERFNNRIIRGDFGSYRDYFAAVQRCDVVVIPLLDDAFNACKSAIRYLEVSLLARPCISSRVGDIINVAKHGEDVLFAESEQDWVDCLQQLLSSAQKRARLGATAKAKVASEQTSAIIAANLEADLVATLAGVSYDD